MQIEPKTTESLIAKYPYRLLQVRGPDGDIVWLQEGVNPDNVFDDKRRSKWPFSQVIADLICTKVCEGASLTQICKEPGFPSYNVVVRWRRENLDFAVDLKRAFEDRAEFYMEFALQTIEELPKTLEAARLKVQTYMDLGSLYREKSQEKEASLTVISAR